MTVTNFSIKKKTIKTKKFILRKPLIKKSIVGFKKAVGKNHSGKITVRHKGNGHKNKYRNINFSRIESSIGITCSVEYDPNRNSSIAALYDFLSNRFFYIISPKNLKIGDILKSGIFSEIKLGHSLPISQIPVGSYVYNLTLGNCNFAKISRAAGAFSEIKIKKLNSAIVRVNSGKCIVISSRNFATIGIVSNSTNFLSKLKKAGQTRWIGKRPTVRGVAMNPVDHPNGGGEGKKSGKNKTPWGKFNF